MLNENECSQPMIVSITSTSKFFKGIGCGTGFFVKENLIATNIHCIAGATSASVKLLDSNTKYDVEGVVAFDDKNDLVILKVSGIGTRCQIGNSDIIEKGDIVKAVGCIEGKYETIKGEFQSYVNKGQWLQTTAKTKDGYSGGPLLDGKELVIGVNFVSTDYSSEAISSNILTELVDETCTIESFDQWQERKAICGWGYIVQSKVKEQARDYASAITCYDEAIQRNPNIIKWYYNRGSMKVQLTQSESEEGNSIQAKQYLQGAIEDFTQAINLCPDYALAYNNRANATRLLAKSENTETSQVLYHDAMIDINIAIERHSNDSIEEYPVNALFHHTRGEIKEAMGDLSGAIDDFKKASQNTKYVKDSRVSADLKRVQDKLNQQE